MRCTVANCQDAVMVREPVPLCGPDAARLLIAYGQAQLGAEEQPVEEEPQHEEEDAGEPTPGMARHMEIVASWLVTEPNLSGAAIGKRLGTGDSYGRRVKRAVTDRPGDHPQMTEQQARGVIAAASESTSVRDLVALTGWSIGWVHARRAELRADG